MKLRKPDYYDRFQCIAGACSDSCCIGWEIDINEEQKQIYAQFSDKSGAGSELGARMKTCIDWEEGHFILLGKEERCPFLNQENLCDLIIGLGEDSLCDICREHPRFYDWFDGLKEVGLGLCCEAAGRLILESEEPAKFVVEGITDEEFDVMGEDEELLDILFSARETAIYILQNRKQSVWKRMEYFLNYVETLQDALDFGSLDEMEEIAAEFGYITEESAGSENICIDMKSDQYRKLLKLCRRLEPIDDSWTKTLSELEIMAESFQDRESQELDGMEAAALEQTCSREYEYEHLMVYFVYRYFMKCREDGDVLSKGYLAVFCLILIRLLDIKTFVETGAVTMEDRVQNAKCISKEIEYSEENLDTLADAFWSER